MELIVRQNIETELKVRNMSLAELSRLSGVPYPTLTDLMKNDATPRVDTVGAIARGFGITPGRLLESPLSRMPETTLRDLLVALSALDNTQTEQVLTFVNSLRAAAAGTKPGPPPAPQSHQKNEKIGN